MTKRKRGDNPSTVKKKIRESAAAEAPAGETIAAGAGASMTGVTAVTVAVTTVVTTAAAIQKPAVKEDEDVIIIERPETPYKPHPWRFNNSSTTIQPYADALLQETIKYNTRMFYNRICHEFARAESLAALQLAQFNWKRLPDNWFELVFDVEEVGRRRSNIVYAACQCWALNSRTTCLRLYERAAALEIYQNVIDNLTVSECRHLTGAEVVIKACRYSESAWMLERVCCVKPDWWEYVPVGTNGPSDENGNFFLTATRYRNHSALRLLCEHMTHCSIDDMRFAMYDACMIKNTEAVFMFAHFLAGVDGEGKRLYRFLDFDKPVPHAPPGCTLATAIAFRFPGHDGTGARSDARDDQCSHGLLRARVEDLEKWAYDFKRMQYLRVQSWFIKAIPEQLMDHCGLMNLIRDYLDDADHPFDFVLPSW